MDGVQDLHHFEKECVPVLQVRKVEKTVDLVCGWRLRNKQDPVLDSANSAWTILKGLLQCLPNAKGVFTELHVHALPAKLDSFHAEPEPLFRSGLTSQFDLATGTHDALPGYPVLFSKQSSHCSVIQRIACSSGYLPVRRDPPPGDGANDAPKSGIALLVLTKRIFQNSSLEVLREVMVTHAPNYTKNGLS